MSLLKSNSVQIGQSATATNNFTLSVPSSPDGTIKLARGNSGATTADVLTVNASGAITGATISGATITSSTVNGGSITSGTAQASTSGTAIDFTGIPSWAKRVSVLLNKASTSGTSNILIQLGTSGGIDASSYEAQSSIVNTAVATNNSTSGFIIRFDEAAARISGIMTIAFVSNNIWVASGAICNVGGTASVQMVAGAKELSTTLDRVRIRSGNGTDTFDAGSVNIMYEG